jgi:hypothetical protein
VLEERYRSLLRVLPATYRAEWEEEMVATYLSSVATDDPEDADYLADHGRPGWSEVASVAGLAVRLRLPALGYAGGTGGPARPRLLGDAIRLVALIGLLVGAASAVVGLGMHLWLAGTLPEPAPPPPVWAPAVTGPWPTTVVLLVFAACPAYVALVTGHRSAARLLASISVGATLVSAAAGVVLGDPLLAGRWVALLIDVLLVAAIWAHHDDAPPVRRRPWLIALPVAVAVAAAVVVGSAGVPVTWWLLDWPALCSIAVTVGVAVHLAALAVGRRPAPAVRWSLALALLAATVLVQRLVTLTEFVAHAGADQRTAVLLSACAEALAVLAVGLPVAVRASRAWWDLPATTVTPARTLP